MEINQTYRTDLNESDLTTVTSLFNHVRKTSLPVQFFLKKYSRTWVDQDLLCSSLFNDGNLIGFAGTTLYKFTESENKEFVIAQLSDLVMHDKYQGMGLFKNLISHLEKRANERNIDGLIVFPNNSQQKKSLKI